MGTFNAAALTAIREAKGLTITGLAEEAGVSRTCVSKIEAGERTPRPWVVLALARGLKVDPDALLPGGPGGPGQATA
jgi:transcriptional regulator with XRE-family HTH domain